MNATMRLPAMARKRGRPATGRNDVTVRIDADVKRDADTVAARRGMDLNVFLSELLKPAVAKELAIEVAKMVKEASPDKPKR